MPSFSPLVRGGTPCCLNVTCNGLTFCGSLACRYGNHSRRPGLIYIDKHTQPDIGEGEWCLDALMAQRYDSLTAENIATEVRRPGLQLLCDRSRNSGARDTTCLQTLV